MPALRHLAGSCEYCCPWLDVEEQKIAQNSYLNSAWLRIVRPCLAVNVRVRYGKGVEGGSPTVGGDCCQD